MATPDTVLLLTHSADHFTVDRVADGLARRGARPIRFNTDDFPSNVRLVSHRHGRLAQLAWFDGNDRVEREQIRAVWCRRIWTPRLDDRLDPRFREMCQRESLAAITAWLDGLHPVRWVNDPACEHVAQNKMRQLRLAADIGLDTPRTLLTNDPDRVRAFYDELDGRMVAKLLRPLAHSMTRAEAAVRTNLVKPEDLDALEHLRHCPMVFQEQVPKARELRIACVRGCCFVGAIDARESTSGAVDWRRATPEECRWQPDDLPPPIQEKLTELLDRLGLIFGAVDLIRTPDDRCVFLEINPAGEWGMLERDLHLPIADAIAAALLDDTGGRP